MVNAQSRFDFSDASVLVTGATSGIGHAIASAFSGAGARVIATGTRPSAADYRTDLSPFTYRQLDVRDTEAIATLGAELDALDVLVNNAGASLPGGQSEWQSEVFEESVRINLFSAFHLANACQPLLQRSTLAGGASIISIASMTSFFGQTMVPGYGAAKAGLVQLTKTLAMTWANDGIRANAIAAGFIETPMTQQMAASTEMSAPVITRTPAGRWGQAGDVAPTVLFLASGEASFITGQTLAVDGGFSIAG